MFRWWKETEQDKSWGVDLILKSETFNTRIKLRSNLGEEAADKLITEISQYIKTTTHVEPPFLCIDENIFIPHSIYSTCMILVWKTHGE